MISLLELKPNTIKRYAVSGLLGVPGEIINTGYQSHKDKKLLNKKLSKKQIDKIIKDRKLAHKISTMGFMGSMGGYAVDQLRKHDIEDNGPLAIKLAASTAAGWGAKHLINKKQQEHLRNKLYKQNNIKS